MAFPALGEKLGRLARRSGPGTDAPARDDEPEPAAPPAEKQRARRLTFLRPGSTFGIYFGLLLIAAGFATIGVAWGKVAAELQVALQLPYLVSGGLTGLGLIITGATVVNIAVKRRDATKQVRQLEQLAEIMRELREEIEKEARGR